MIRFLDREFVKEEQLKYVSKDKSSNIYFFSKVVSTDNTLLTLFSTVKGLGFKRRLRIFFSFAGLGFMNKAVGISDFLFLNFQTLVRRLYLGSFIKKNELRNLYLGKKIKLYHSLRYFLNLPVRGQRSKTNAGTIKRMRRASLLPKVKSSKKVDY